MSAALPETIVSAPHRAPGRNGAERLLDALVRHRVDTVFGYPGGACLPIYDALHGESRIRHVLVRHEQAAVHAAEGYARSTGRPGVVLVTLAGWNAVEPAQPSPGAPPVRSQLVPPPVCIKVTTLPIRMLLESAWSVAYGVA